MHPDDIESARLLKARLKATEWGKTITAVEPTFDGSAYRVTFRPTKLYNPEAELEALVGLVKPPLAVRAAEVITDHKKHYLVIEITGAEA